MDGSWALSQQLAYYRTLDDLDRRRKDNSLALRDAAWRNQYNELVNNYNRLLHDSNRLADVQDRAINSQAQQIAELTGINASLADEVKRLRLELMSVRGIANLKRMGEEERMLKERTKGV